LLTSSFHTIDWIIIVLYLAGMAGVGVYFARRQSSLDHYVLADRKMGWLPVGLSLMAALNSGMDYLMQPSSTIKFGFVVVLGVLSWLAVYPWVSTVVFPFYRRLNFYTAYEYLEARFDVRVRTLAALIFIVWRLGWMATAMYVPSLAINAATGGQVDLNTMTIVVGVVVTLYTMLGGIQAVIWNDVIQFCIMFGGLGATVAIVFSSVPGGVPEIWNTAAAAGKLNFAAPHIDPAATGLAAQAASFFTQPITAIPLLISLVVGRTAQYTIDQIMVQRVQTTKSVRDARQAFVINAIGDALWMIGLCSVGLALFAYFQRHPLPAEFQTDKLVPYFMSIEFPAGAVGLVIAAIMAASLSSIDSAINSCSSVVVIDLYNRVWLNRTTGSADLSAADQRQQIMASRVATLLVGIAGTTLACNVSRIGSLLEIANKLINSLQGPLFGLFLLAMFSRRASSMAVLIGGVVGTAMSYYIAYGSSLSFLWPSTFGLVATLLSGAALTMVMPSPLGAPGRELTWCAVMNRQTAS
jgi:SSS family transporter